MQKLSHIVAGASVGLILYSCYLFVLLRFWRRYATIIMTPQYNTMDLWPQHRISRLMMLSQWQWPEIIAVLCGLVLPVVLGFVGYWYAQHRPVAILSSWPVPVILGCLGLGAVLAVPLTVFLFRRAMDHQLQNILHNL